MADTPPGSRIARLDPFALPVRFAAFDKAADAQVRDVELHRERVVVRRSLAGMRMALNLPVSAFAGIGLKVTASEGRPAVAVVLAHKDPGLALPLSVAAETDDVLADWKSWASVLGLPLLVEDAGGWREPYTRLGGLRIADVRPRRRRRSALRKRRPSMSMRRAAGKLTEATPVHRGEREIIARN